MEILITVQKRWGTHYQQAVQEAVGDLFPKAKLDIRRTEHNHCYVILDYSDDEFVGSDMADLLKTDEIEERICGIMDRARPRSTPRRQKTWRGDLWEELRQEAIQRAEDLRVRKIIGSMECVVAKVNGSDAGYRRKYPGTVMFSTRHDITPRNIDACLKALTKLLQAGNRVLIVSKPHLDCIKRLCAKLGDHRDRVWFRFTIGTRNDALLEYWEPGAPRYAERKSALVHAHKSGFVTSVSIEPMLDSTDVVNLFRELEPFVTDFVWIGKMKQAEQRVKPETPHDREMLQRVIDGQSDERIREIHEALKSEPKIRWKESSKVALGLPLETEAGTDG